MSRRQLRRWLLSHSLFGLPGGSNPLSSQTVFGSALWPHCCRWVSSLAPGRKIDGCTSCPTSRESPAAIAVDLLRRNGAGQSDDYACEIPIDSNTQSGSGARVLHGKAGLSACHGSTVERQSAMD